MTIEEILTHVQQLEPDDRRAIARAVFASLGPPNVTTESSMAANRIVRGTESVLRTIEALPQHSPLFDGLREWLEATLDEGDYPVTLSGDLAHLLVTIEHLYQTLAALAGGGGPKRRRSALAQLWALHFDLTESLQPLVQDLSNELAAVVPKRARDLQ